MRKLKIKSLYEKKFASLGLSNLAKILKVLPHIKVVNLRFYPKSF